MTRGLLTSVVPTTIKNSDLVKKRRKQIVLAAIKLFSEKGFHKTTLRELADEIGISHGNIYDYVGNKEDIFFLIHELMADIADEGLLKSIERVSDPLEKLRRMVRSEFNLMYQWDDAILLIYQESNILKDGLLKKFLQREREHVSKFEDVLKECVEKGVFQDTNCRVVANLIKVMTDSWVLKRWDLRKHVTQAEMEKCILDLVFSGLLLTEHSVSTKAQNNLALSGKTALILNGGTIHGRAITSFFVSKGANLCVCGKGLKGELNGIENVCLYPINSYAEMTPSFISKVLDELGQVDIVIIDIGTDISGMASDYRNDASSNRNLERNFSICQDITLTLEERMVKQSSGRIIFLAPWSWDRFIDPLHYQTVKAGVATFTRNLAEHLASYRINVNCVVPGFIKGSKPLTLEKEYESKVLEKIPIKLFGEARDVVEAVYFFASDVSKYITGQVLEVSGGFRD